MKSHTSIHPVAQNKAALCISLTLALKPWTVMRNRPKGILSCFACGRRAEVDPRKQHLGAQGTRSAFEDSWRYRPSTNGEGILLCFGGGSAVTSSFLHEQCLLICYGCASLHTSSAAAHRSMNVYVSPSIWVDIEVQTSADHLSASAPSPSSGVPNGMGDSLQAAAQSIHHGIADLPGLQGALCRRIRSCFPSID